MVWDMWSFWKHHIFKVIKRQDCWNRCVPVFWCEAEISRPMRPMVNIQICFDHLTCSMPVWIPSSPNFPHQKYGWNGGKSAMDLIGWEDELFGNLAGASSAELFVDPLGSLTSRWNRVNRIGPVDCLLRKSERKNKTNVKRLILEALCTWLVFFWTHKAANFQNGFKLKSNLRKSDFQPLQTHEVHSPSFLSCQVCMVRVIT